MGGNAVYEVWTAASCHSRHFFIDFCSSQFDIPAVYFIEKKLHELKRFYAGEITFVNKVLSFYKTAFKLERCFDYTTAVTDFYYCFKKLVRLSVIIVFGRSVPQSVPNYEIIM